MNNLELSIKRLAKESNSRILKLLNRNKEPVASLYLDKLSVSFEDITVTATEKYTGEKYFLYLSGIAIFFSYYEAI